MSNDKRVIGAVLLFLVGGGFLVAGLIATNADPDDTLLHSIGLIVLAVGVIFMAVQVFRSRATASQEMSISMSITSVGIALLTVFDDAVAAQIGACGLIVAGVAMWTTALDRQSSTSTEAEL